MDIYNQILNFISRIIWISYSFGSLVLCRIFYRWHGNCLFSFPNIFSAGSWVLPVFFVMRQSERSMDDSMPKLRWARSVLRVRICKDTCCSYFEMLILNSRKDTGNGIYQYCFRYLFLPLSCIDTCAQYFVAGPWQAARYFFICSLQCATQEHLMMFSFAGVITDKNHRPKNIKLSIWIFSYKSAAENTGIFLYKILPPNISNWFFMVYKIFNRVNIAFFAKSRLFPLRLRNSVVMKKTEKIFTENISTKRKQSLFSWYTRYAVGEHSVFCKKNCSHRA